MSPSCTCETKSQTLRYSRIASTVTPREIWRTQALACSPAATVVFAMSLLLMKCKRDGAMSLMACPINHRPV
jgi:hypothetical protein